MCKRCVCSAAHFPHAKPLGPEHDLWRWNGVNLPTEPASHRSFSFPSMTQHSAAQHLPSALVFGLIKGRQGGRVTKSIEVPLPHRQATAGSCTRTSPAAAGTRPSPPWRLATPGLEAPTHSVSRTLPSSPPAGSQSSS